MESAQCIHLAIAEDSHKWYHWLEQKLRVFPSVCIDFRAHNGKELVEYIQQHKPLPDVILMDIEMPEMNGIEATRIIKHAYPQARITALTHFDDDEQVYQMIQAGSSGYLLKEISAEELVRHVHILHEGGAAMTPSIALKVIEHIRLSEKPVTEPASHHLLQLLTKREKEILYLIRDGLQNKEISDQLHISPLTVRTHIEHIYEKLHVSNRVEASNFIQKF